MCAGLVPTFPVCWEPVEPAWSPPATEAECHPGHAHTAVTSPTNPGRYYRPAGNIPAGGRERYLDCFIIGGPHGPACGNIPAPFGNVTGWREYYRRLGTSPAGGDIPGLWRGHSRIPGWCAGIFRLARGYSRQGGWISRGTCPAVKWVLTRLTTVGSNVAKRHAESKQQTGYNNCCFS